MTTHRRWFALWLALCGCNARGQTVNITEDDVVQAGDDTPPVGDDAQATVDRPSLPDAQVPVDARVGVDVQTPIDIPFVGDDVVTPRDVVVAVDRVTPVDRGSPVDTGPVSVFAGGACATDDECGGELGCFDNLIGGGWCSTPCDNSTSAVAEQAQCGGAGSTCLRRRPAAGATAEASFCTRACSVTATSERTGGCRTGHVCTYYWYAQPATDPVDESPGCFPFCTSDSQCVGVVVRDTAGEVVPGMMANRCNTRTGFCQAAAPSATLLADGMPCNPQQVAMTMVPVCRGVCFSTSSASPTQGICGSFLNTQVAPSCPDDATMVPLTPGDDNLAICIFKPCAHNSACTGALRCVYPETTAGGTTTVRMDAAPTCGYPTAMQPTGIP